MSVSTAYADRNGQRLRNNLIDRMYHDGRPQNPKYELAITLRETEEGIGLFAERHLVSLTELNLYADYILKDPSGKEVVHATAHAVATFNQLQQEYGTPRRQRKCLSAMHRPDQRPDPGPREPLFLGRKHHQAAAGAERKTTGAQDNAMKWSAAQASAFLQKPDPAVRVVLIYGPDAGLVSERSETLAKKTVPDLSNPFQVAVLTGAMVSGRSATADG